MATDTVSVVTAILGGFILLFGLSSLVIKERLYLSEASIALVCGIIFGPICANFINIQDWGNQVQITHEYTRIVIAIQVMAAGVSLPKAYLRTEFKSILILIGPVMIYMWLVSGLLVWAFIPGLNFLEALVIAACFTPTDPILANSIVQGKFAEKHVPKHVRDIISCESGANDGFGYPFLFLAIYLLQMDVGPAIGKWAYWIMAYNILLSIVIGLVAGFVARKLLRIAEERKFIDKECFLVFSVALALFLMGTVGLIGSDDLLACFIAGNSFTWNDWFRVETENAHLMEVVDVLLNLSVFVYIGVTMPWSLFNDVANQIVPWRLVVLGLLVLLLRRLPIVLTLYKCIPAIHSWREAIFTGWFGPIGVSALFYYTIAVESLPEDGPNAHARTVLQPVIYFMVLFSVVAHGITIPLFYIGHFATRSVTRTSENGNQVLRIPKIEKFIEARKKRSTPPLDEADIANIHVTTEGIPINENNSKYAQAPRHTAITIVTPNDTILKEQQEQQSATSETAHPCVNNSSNIDSNNNTSSSTDVSMHGQELFLADDAGSQYLNDSAYNLPTSGYVSRRHSLVRDETLEK